MITTTSNPSPYLAPAAGTLEKLCAPCLEDLRISMSETTIEQANLEAVQEYLDLFGLDSDRHGLGRAWTRTSP